MGVRGTEILAEATTSDEDVQHFAHTRIVRHTNGNFTPRDRDSTRNVALIVSNHDNSATATIGDRARVDSPAAIRVNADARFPNAGIDWPELPDLTDLTDLELSLDTLANADEIKEEFAEFKEDLVAEGDILAGLVTTSAKAHGLKNGTDERLASPVPSIFSISVTKQVRSLVTMSRSISRAPTPHRTRTSWSPPPPSLKPST